MSVLLPVAAILLETACTFDDRGIFGKRTFGDRYTFDDRSRFSSYCWLPLLVATLFW